MNNQQARKTASDAVDGSSTGIVMWQIVAKFAAPHVAFWHKAVAFNDGQHRPLSGAQQTYSAPLQTGGCCAGCQ